MKRIKLFAENAQSSEPQSISEIFDNTIGEKVTIIDSTNFMLRTTGTSTYVDDGKIEIRANLCRIIITVNSIKSYKRFPDEEGVRNYKFYLKNGNSFTILY